MSITGQRLKERRKKININADDVASELGVSRSTIFRYENGYIEKVPANVIEKLAKILKTTPAYLMGWDDDPTDWEQAANDAGISPTNDFDGDSEDWYRMKVATDEDHEQEESEQAKKFFSDIRFEQLVTSYILLNESNKDKVINYAEKILETQRLECTRAHIEPKAAHERTDIEITDEMKKHDDDIMNNDDFWK